MQVVLSPKVTELLNEQVQSGQYESPMAVLEEALRALKERDDREYWETVEGIRRGLADAEAGRVQPLTEAFQEIRRRDDVPR